MTAVSYTHLDVADRCAVGEQHYESVYAEAESTGRSETVFESGDVVLINLRGRVRVLRTLCGDLTLEAFLLINRIVELRECVSELGRINEVLESFGEGGLGRLSLCERAVLDLSLIHI